MITLTLSHGGNAQEFAPADFPMAIQMGDGGALIIGADVEGVVVAWLIAHSEGLSVQPERSKVQFRLNGAQVSEAAWLQDGDNLSVGKMSFRVSRDGNAFGLISSNPSTPNISPPEVSAQAEKPRAASSAPKFEHAPRRPRVRMSKGRGIALAVIAILAACVAYVLTASPLVVHFDPEADSVSVSGFPPAIRVGEGYLALPGRYTVQAEKEGYRPFRREIAVDFGTKDPFRFTLQKGPGRLRVTTEPDGAKVYADGTEVGTTPAQIELESGERELRVEKDRYLTETRKVSIEGLGKEQSLEIQLKPAWGNLTINSRPPGAAVNLDGREVGQTPLTVEALHGTRQVELSKDGWKPAKQAVEVQAGSTVTVPEIELERLDGTIIVESDPAGSSVLVNGQFRGQTPVTLTVPGDKSHQITISKAGFETATRNIRAEAGGSARVSARLLPETGVVYLTTTPAGASLRINGKESGSATQRLTLQTVPQTFEISKEGYQSRSISVTPQNGVPKRIDVALKSAGAALKERATQGIRTAGGQRLILVPIAAPVKVALGSSRRDPARRSNESEYQVELTRPYLLSEKEITNTEFRKFKASHSSGSQLGTSLDGPEQPVVNVSWEDAARYANWLSEQEKLSPAYKEAGGKISAVHPIPNGYRLPTEAEWEFAARFDGGSRTSGAGLRFSWGESTPPPANAGNFAHDGSGLPFVVAGYTDKFLATSPVGSFQAGRTGLHDISGNVSEWCHDFYDIIGSAAAPPKDSAGPTTGRFHVIKGSSWRSGSTTELRAAYRDYADKPRDDLGFRIARYADAQ